MVSDNNFEKENSSGYSITQRDRPLIDSFPRDALLIILARPSPPADGSMVVTLEILCSLPLLPWRTSGRRDVGLPEYAEGATELGNELKCATGGLWTGLVWTGDSKGCACELKNLGPIWRGAKRI